MQKPTVFMAFMAALLFISSGFPTNAEDGCIRLHVENECARDFKIAVYFCYDNQCDVTEKKIKANSSTIVLSKPPFLLKGVVINGDVKLGIGDCARITDDCCVCLTRECKLVFWPCRSGG